MLIAVILPLAVAAFGVLQLAKRAQSRPIGIGVLAACLSVALMAGGYGIGKDMAQRDAHLPPAQADAAR